MAPSSPPTHLLQTMSSPGQRPQLFTSAFPAPKYKQQVLTGCRAQNGEQGGGQGTPAQGLGPAASEIETFDRAEVWCLVSATNPRPAAAHSVSWIRQSSQNMSLDPVDFWLLL